MVTFWATKEAHAASAEFARKLTEKVVEETGEQVLSVRDFILAVGAGAGACAWSASLRRLAAGVIRVPLTDAGKACPRLSSALDRDGEEDAAHA